MTDRQLLDIQTSISQHGDELAFRQLYDHFYTPLHLFARALTGSGLQAEEVTHDVFIKLWRQREKLGEIKNLKTYLFVVTRNVSLNYRKDKRQLSAQDGIPDFYLRFRDSVTTPEEQLLSKEVIHHVNQAIQALPPRCKLIFMLVKENGLKYQEVSEILNLSVNTVENQMSTALKRLGRSVDRQMMKK